jgi:hypothetical protein
LFVACETVFKIVTLWMTRRGRDETGAGDSSVDTVTTAVRGRGMNPRLRPVLPRVQLVRRPEREAEH